MATAPRVLVLDDEKNITVVIQAMLKKAGIEASMVNDPRDALRMIRSEEFDTLITDLYMRGMTGLEVLEHAQKIRPQMPVVMITAFGTVESAVSALKKGAFDFITKPFDQAELLSVVRKATETARLNRLEPELPIESAPEADSGFILGESQHMREIYRTIGKVAPSDATVLITGESGTGKELIALQLHERSARASGPFVRLNCAAIPANLIEAELFGFEKGAFTGAVSAKPGRFELAHEGTLFLDEVGEMSLEMQVKLLRAIQQHEFERVGGLQTMKVDVRIVAATNRDLDEAVREGRFREDLFYRLNVVPVHLPPLRERREDIDALAIFFLKQCATKLKREGVRFSEEALAALRAFRWPGNIRQLENAIERAALLSEGGVIRLKDFPPEIGGEIPESLTPTDSDSVNFKEIVKRQTQAVERELIEKALQETEGNVTRAAEKLGISRKGLQLKIKELGIRDS